MPDRRMYWENKKARDGLRMPMADHKMMMPDMPEEDVPVQEEKTPEPEQKIHGMGKRPQSDAKGIKAKVTPIDEPGRDGNEESASGICTPLDFDWPAFLMCSPMTMSTENPNNVWMKKEREPINYPKAFAQWSRLYRAIINAGAWVYILPSGDYDDYYQDAVYVSNLALIPPFKNKEDICILAKMQSPPRQGEEEVGKDFFTLMGFEVMQPPAFFEGAAECKWLHDDIYVGGVGERSKAEAYDWMENLKDVPMKIIRVAMNDPKNYHLDTLVEPITQKKTLVDVPCLDKRDVEAIGKQTEIIAVPEQFKYRGLTNFIRVHDSLFLMSDIMQKKTTDKDYNEERDAMKWFEDMCVENGMQPVLVNLSEFSKSGADASCLACDLNAYSFFEKLL